MLEGSLVVDESVVAALSSSTRALDLQTGTGAGAGSEERLAAGAGGDEVVAALSELDVLTNLLFWRLLAPTAPDSLTCYPFHESDPFVMRELPHVFFSGAAKAFGSRLVADAAGGARVRVVCVPDFAATRTAVLVDISSPTLECQPVRFDVVE